MAKACPKHCQNTAKIWPQHCQIIANTWPKYCQHIANTLPKHCKRIAKTLPTHCQHIANTLPTYCQNIANILPTHCQHIASALQNHCQNIDKTLPRKHNVPNKSRTIMLRGGRDGEFRFPFFVDFSSRILSKIHAKADIEKVYRKSRKKIRCVGATFCITRAQTKPECEPKRQKKPECEPKRPEWRAKRAEGNQKGIQRVPKVDQNA